MPAPARLTFLIDTNVFVTLEPFGSVGETEPFDEAATFARRVHEHGHLTERDMRKTPRVLTRMT